jgi:hypothetical protein
MPQALFGRPFAIRVEVRLVRGLVPKHDQRETVGLRVANLRELLLA